ncbi:MAG: phosphocholine cytidylyltransferase family protein, partial [Lachnospiraceae bacterium]|nr:phosphocholine cytidylyltransferase family protein [Lachnospiraceae bacterium]
MQAIILAAGMGKRLKELTEHNTKCMVRVNGETLIERMLSQLDKLALERIVIVVGYKQEVLKDYIRELLTKTPIIFVENTVYDKTNNIYSLYLAKDYLLEKDTLLLESDLIFEDAILEELVNDERDTLALVDKYESWMSGTCVKLGADDSIEAFVPGKNFRFEEIKDYYKTVNVYKFSRKFSETHYVPFLEA